MFGRFLPLINLPRSAAPYFTYEISAPLSRGTLVKLPYRRKKIWGVYLEEEKHKPNFKTLPIIEAYPDFILPAWLINATERLSRQFLDNHAGLLYDSIKNWLGAKTFVLNTDKVRSQHEISMIRVSRSDLNCLKKLVGRKNSLVMFGSSALAGAVFGHELFKEFNVNLIVGAENKSTLKNIIEDESSGQKIYFGIRNAIFLPVHNLEQIIYWEPAHDFYTEQERAPYLDYVHAGCVVAQERALPLIMAGPSLPVILSDQKFVQSYNLLKPTIIQHRASSKIPFAPSFIKHIENCLSQKHSVIIYHNSINKQSSQFCLDCKTMLPAEASVCPMCSGACLINLPALNIRQLKEQLADDFGKSAVIDLTYDTMRTNRDYANKIIICSSQIFTMPLPWKNEIGLVIVPGLSSLSRKGDFKESERSYHTLWQCADLAQSTKSNLLLALPDDLLEAWNFLGHAEVEKAFWNDLLADRKKFGYPPYKNLLTNGKNDLGNPEARELVDWLNKHLDSKLRSMPTSIHLQNYELKLLYDNLPQIKIKNLPKIVPSAYNQDYGTT